MMIANLMERIVFSLTSTPPFVALIFTFFNEITLMLLGLSLTTGIVF